MSAVDQAQRAWELNMMVPNGHVASKGSASREKSFDSPDPLDCELMYLAPLHPPHFESYWSKPSTTKYLDGKPKMLY